MQYDQTITLFDRLSHNATDVEQALSSGNVQEIQSLIEAHNQIISELKLSDSPLNIEMKPAVERAEKNVRGLVSKIQDMQNDIKNQLSTMNKKRMIDSAYKF